MILKVGVTDLYGVRWDIGSKWRDQIVGVSDVATNEALKHVPLHPTPRNI